MTSRPKAPAAINPLAELLHRIDMKPEQLIARMNELRCRRGWPPLDLKTAYPWVRTPAVRPTDDNRPDALAVLTTRAGEPITADAMGWTGPRRRRPHRWMDAPGQAPAIELLQEISQGDHPMDRRTLLLTGAAVTAPALALLIGADSPLRAAEQGTRVSPKLVAGIETSVREIRELDDSEGGAAGLVWAGGLWKTLAGVIAGARYNSAVSARLNTAFIQLCEQYGWMLFDADQHPQAQRVFQTGMSLARETGDARTATSNLLASTAYQAAWLGQHTEARTLLDVAVRGDMPPRLRAVIAEREIFAAGRRGDTQALSRARDNAHDQLDAADTDGLWWAHWLTHHALDAATGRAWLAANRPADAEPYLTRRLNAADGNAFPRDRMLAALDLADTHRLSGDPDAAATVAQQAAHLLDRVDSARARGRLQEVGNALAPHRHRPAVQTLLSTI